MCTRTSRTKRPKIAYLGSNRQYTWGLVLLGKPCHSNLLGYSANYLVDYAYLPNGKQARYGYLVFFIHAYTDNINVGSGAFGNNGHDRKAREIIGHMQPIACPEILAMDCTIRALQKYSNRHHFAESAFNPCFHV